MLGVRPTITRLRNSISRHVFDVMVEFLFQIILDARRECPHRTEREIGRKSMSDIFVCTHRTCV